MGGEPASTPEPTIIEVRHTSGGIVALLSNGALVRLFLVSAAAVATVPGEDELIGLTVAAARELAGARGASLLPEGDAAPE
jgi:hypothetical protein